MFKLGFVKPPLIFSSLAMGLKNPVVSLLLPFEPLYFWKGTLKVLLPTEDPPTDDKQTRVTKVTQRNARIAEQEENESLLTNNAIIKTLLTSLGKEVGSNYVCMHSYEIDLAKYLIGALLMRVCSGYVFSSYHHFPVRKNMIH